MIIESITMQVLQVVLSAITQQERLGTARYLFGASSAAEGWLTVFAIAALLTAIILVIWLSAENRRSLERLKQDISELGLITAIDELRLHIAELGQQKPAEATEQMPSQEFQKSEELVAIENG